MSLSSDCFVILPVWHAWLKETSLCAGSPPIGWQYQLTNESLWNLNWFGMTSCPVSTCIKVFMCSMLMFRPLELDHTLISMGSQ